MAKPFFDNTSETLFAEAVQITDIVASGESAATEATAQTTPAMDTSLPPGKMPKLKDVDKFFGPLRFGQVTVSREELHVLGAKISGQEVTAANTYFKTADQAFYDALELDPAKVAARMISAADADSHNVSTFMFELATLRSDTAGPLMRKMPAGDNAAQMDKISNTLNTVQRLQIHDASHLDQMPGWVDRAKSRAMTSMGAGMQAFGLYSAYRGTLEALKNRDWVEAGLNAGGGMAEIASLGLEYALSKTGEAMIRNGALAFEQFGKTTAGLRLIRGAGLIASVLTLPFDIYTAVKSFSEAAVAEGKKAQDLYVTGAMSVVSAGLSLALGVAALAGFSYAGPVGLGAAAIMILGAKIYAAARVVDDIDDYIELTFHENLRSGWFAFTGQDLDQDVMDRYKLEKTFADNFKATKKRNVKWLENELKDSMEAIVSGRISKSLKSEQIAKFSWDPAAGELPYVTVNTPTLEDADDNYNCWYGLPTDNEQITFGKIDPDNPKGILWQLGGGNDDVTGVGAKPNTFMYGSGKKILQGGWADDTFVFQQSHEALKLEKPPSVIEVGRLHGGDGKDLLWLQGEVPRNYSSTEPPYKGFIVDLPKGKLSLRSSQSSEQDAVHSTIQSFEKIQTLKRGSNRVYGTDNAEEIGVNGNDYIKAGGGDDQISVNSHSAIVDGGRGNDTYLINGDSLDVSLIEDGHGHSTVYLGVSLESIQSWLIKDNALLIESLRGDAQGLPRRTLTIEGAYQTINGKRTLRNDKWTFITQDGYYLQPDLPGETAELENFSIKTIVLSPGIPKTSPTVLNNYQTVPTDADSFYYISADTAIATLNASKHDKVRLSTVYIDYDSQDISEVRAHYHVDMVPEHIYKKLIHKNVSLTLLFKCGATVLSLDNSMFLGFKNGAYEPYPSIRMGRWFTTHGFILVMRDGVSYRVDCPNLPYLDDVQTQGIKVVESRFALNERAGKYLFVKPGIKQITLKNTAQRIDFKNMSHASDYYLEGRSAHYEIYPSSNISIHLSTAEKDARTYGSSNWVIYTAQLEKPVLRSQLSITGSLLKINSIHVYLPDSDDPELPIETVDVCLASGHRYRVNNLFETISLFSMDATVYSSVAAIAEEINRHHLAEELESEETPVDNLYLTATPSEKIHYNASSKTWHVTQHPARTVLLQDLNIGKPPALQKPADSTSKTIDPTVKE